MLFNEEGQHGIENVYSDRDQAESKAKRWKVMFKASKVEVERWKHLWVVIAWFNSPEDADEAIKMM